MDGLTDYRRVRHVKSLDILLEQLPKNPRLASDPRFLARDGPNGGGADDGAHAATGGQSKDESFEDTHEGLIPDERKRLSLYDNTGADEKLLSTAHGHPEGSDAQGQAVPHETVERSSGGMQWMADAVDKILLQRTQMRHQLETLRNSRAYLEASLQDLFAMLDGLELSDTGLGETPAGDVDTTASAGQSSGADAHRGVFQYQLPWSPVEQEEQGTLPKPPLKFHEVLQRTREDLQRVREQEVTFGTALDKLSNSEYRLNEKQKVLMRDLEDPQKTARVMKQMLTEGPEPSVARPGTRSATELPTIVEEYFDRRGDIGVWIERQQELDEAYAEGKEERAFIADRGDPLDVTDEEFDKQFEARREHIERELEIAQKEADELERQCQAEGHDLAAYRTTPRSDTASMMSPSEKPTTSYSPVLQSIRELDPDPIDPQPPVRQPGIKSWLRGLAFGDMEQIDPTITSVPETPVQEPQSFNEPVLSSDSEDLTAAISEAMSQDSSEQHLKQQNPIHEKQRSPSGESHSGIEIAHSGAMGNSPKEFHDIGSRLRPPSITRPSDSAVYLTKSSPEMPSRQSRQASIDASQATSRRRSTSDTFYSGNYLASTGSTDQTSAPSLAKAQVLGPTVSNVPRPLSEPTATEASRESSLWDTLVQRFRAPRSP